MVRFVIYCAAYGTEILFSLFYDFMFSKKLPVLFTCQGIIVLAWKRNNCNCCFEHSNSLKHIFKQAFSHCNNDWYLFLQKLLKNSHLMIISSQNKDTSSEARFLRSRILNPTHISCVCNSIFILWTCRESLLPRASVFGF